MIVPLLVFCCLLSSGCGGSGISVSGTVTLDGTPIADGYVSFTPESGTKGPAVAGRIKSGSYMIPGHCCSNI